MFNDFCTSGDFELERMLKSFLSRKLSIDSCDDKETKKLLKSIQEKYNSFFRGK